MDLHSAFSKMKAARGKSMYFFYCEGPNNKPILVIDKRPIAPKDKTEALSRAKDKSKKCAGEMAMNATGELDITPKGSVLSSLARGVQIAARSEHAMLFSGININPAHPEEPETEEPNSKAPEAPPKQKSKGPTPYTTSTVTEEEEPGIEVPKAPPKSYSGTGYGGTSTDDTAPEKDAPDSYTSGKPSDTGYGSTGYGSTGYGGKNNAYPSTTRLKDDSDDEDSDTRPKSRKNWKLDEAEKQRLKTLVAKKHDDALRADPTMAKLIEKKKKAGQELARLLQEPEQDQVKVEKAFRHLEKIDEAMDTAQRILNERGIVPKQIGSEYVDEDKKKGWRQKEPVPPDLTNLSEEEKAKKQEEYEERLDVWKEAREKDDETTKYFTDEEREKSKLQVDEMGRVRDNQGNLKEGFAGYAMDTENKQLHQFNEQGRETDPEGKVKFNHHSSMLSGAEVVGAGGITFQNGKIVSISNSSGHYKPGTVQLIQTVEELLKKGAFLDKTLTATVPLSGKAQDLFDKALDLQDDIERQLANGTERVNRIEEAKEFVEEKTAEYDRLVKRRASGSDIEDAREELDEAIDDLNWQLAEKTKEDRALQKNVETLKKAMPILERLGVSAANKMVGTVDHSFVKQDMSGEEVREVVAEKSSVMDFLSSGGNKEQSENKKQMHEELLQKTAESRKKLDGEAEQRSADVERYFATIESETLPMLRGLQKRLEQAPDGQETLGQLKETIANYEKQLSAREGPSKKDIKKALKALKKGAQMIENTEDDSLVANTEAVIQQVRVVSYKRT